ncbi:tetratricopeptide repeat protein [Robertmurraya korlensis]|uniref:tetratricopeptide repeat protein n=1 Tax=Robertmurraya korlensis TaxID=519977 RepID=UPI0020419964|nr:tetratricopeptide repeat protein [Robertmurraya korlensis]MCM3600884.1 tetratricopeptide repeat protein [Robertmurraya korlensis]
MRKDLTEAIELRKVGELKKSNQILLKLAEEYPENPVISYQCAWSFDVMGEEAKAVPYYETAIEKGLSGADLEESYIGLGSTYRTLGEYEKSKDIFLKGSSIFPNSQAMRVFYSMTLYNLQKHTVAMENLLKCLIETTEDKEILRYKRAIGFYADKLDQVWE